MKKTALIFFLFSVVFAKAQQKNDNGLHQKTIVLKRFLEKNHYQPLTWNDSSSRLLYNKWIQDLDEEKLFFTQKDMAAMEPYKYKLDDELLAKEQAVGVSFFKLSTSLYQTRLQKTDSIIKAVLAKPLDFSKPDNITWPYTGFAGNELEAAFRWQKF